MHYLAPSSQSGAGWGWVWDQHAKYGYEYLIWVRLTLIWAVGLGAGGWAFWLVAGRPVRQETHHKGPRLGGVGVAVEAAKKDRGELLYKVASMPFRLERVRRSMVLLGSPGGGKTQLTWHHIEGLRAAGYRLLVVDGPKGDYSAAMPSDPGGVAVVAPWHQGPVWDIAGDCPTRAHARELAAALIPIDPSQPMWGQAAGGVFVALICELQATRGTAWGWGDLLLQITRPAEELKAVAEQYYPPAMQAVADVESKTTQSILINFTAFMLDVFELCLAWQDPENKLSFTSWWQGETDGPCVVILQGSGQFETLAGGYISAIIRTLASLTADPSFPDSATRKNCIVIDELAQLPKLPKLEKFMEIGRSKGCSLVVATQSPAQLRKVYGEDDLTAWMGMAGTKFYLRTTGADDCQLAIKELGEKEIFAPQNTVTTSANGQSLSNGWAREKMPVVDQEMLEGLGPEKRGITVIVKGFGTNPARVLFPYYPVANVRPVAIPNPAFNQHYGAPANTPSSGEIAGSTGTGENACVHPENEDTEDTDTNPLEQLETLEEDAHRGRLLADSVEVADQQGDECNLVADLAEEAAKDAVCEHLGDALGVDGHGLGAALELLESLESENTAAGQGQPDVCTDYVEGETTNGQNHKKPRRKLRVKKQEIGVAQCM
ncbi:MAG: type IV secretion system DNA-binding domain-containing protein [Gallionellaceae bacterium]|nr:type IV secretion system DNA-binding domain-containing protein [Gallionellaceae bacterium]